jgi:diaminohydroxyphosphoribosylaminopyrimidine deaminase/5-amino-6-(5-phosphoribosylamino)uracil reductase
MAASFADERAVMARALELAARGEGRVEPNPLVGAVLVDDALNLLGEGFHEQFGGPHAEVHALAQAGSRAAGGTLFVTLEPCCHFGKTPPCTEAVIAAGIKRVVVAAEDPFPAVAGQGIARLRQAGLTVEVGLLAAAATDLTAPFRKLVQTGRPYVHAKWAMTLDGKLATRIGSSQWISNALSRGVVHQLRGRMDAILIGRGTAEADNPQLTARPPGPRTATRIVLDSAARLRLDSHLAQTARDVPVIVVTAESADPGRAQQLRDAGLEVLPLPAAPAVGDAHGSPRPRLDLLLDELGRRRFTNLLVEGGSALLGAFFDADLVDEVHVFIGPKLAGGAAAPSPVGGVGRADMPDVPKLIAPQITALDGDVYIRGRLSR